MFYLTSDIIHKDPKVSKIFLKKLLEFGLSNKIDKLVLCFILDPYATNYIRRERGYKKNLIRPCGSRRGKVVLTLLTDFVVCHVRAT